MNRKQFLGTIFGSIIAIPTLFGITSDKNKVNSKLNRVDSELQDLYDYLERQTINNLFKGKIPFKLYPYQKQILKQIHENDKVIIVKARQIGMTTLLTGYMAWKHDRIRNYKYNSFDTMMDVRRNGTLFYRSYYKFKDETQSVCITDELNYKTTPLPNLSYKKNIIVGTPDPMGNLKWIVDRKDEYGFKVFTYTVNDCPEVWGTYKIDNAKRLMPEYVDKELYCKFV